ncbi:MAG: hypothetical protein COU31_01205, partial [Candidatus Magasanikbacteria bacterium CG10_big_fil_rev_8_21_14_0_10_40_10]
THTYSKAAIYNPTFTVTDNQGLSAKTSLSVNVGEVACVKEGESLGAVYPGNISQCCVGLVAYVPYVPFGIVGTGGTCVKPSITVLSPNGGEMWGIGSTQTIKWNTTGYDSNANVQLGIYDIRYNTEGGAYPENNIVFSTKNTGSYTWT